MGKGDFTYACVDVTAGNRPMDIAWLSTNDATVRHQTAKGLQQVLRILRDIRPKCIAIDAPSLLKTDTESDAGGRYCERELNRRGIKLYYTQKESNAAWMETGFALYEELQGRDGYNLFRKPGPVSFDDDYYLLEVFPHASFVVGLGRLPHSKDTFEGKLERLAYLRSKILALELVVKNELLPNEDYLVGIQNIFECTSWSVIADEGVHIPPLPTHDVLDSLVGLVTLLECATGKGFAVGDENEGVIALPTRPIEKYRRGVAV